MDQLVPFRTRLAPDQMQLQARLQRAVKEEDTLSQLLASAKADGTITSDEVVLLANQVARCLERNPNHARINALRQQLVDRIEKKPTEFAQKVEALMPFVASLGGSASLPNNFRQLLNWHEKAKAERQRQSQDLKALLGGDLALRGKPSAAYREKLKGEMRKHLGSELVRCPMCNVECRANRLVKHFDEQHYGTQ